VIDQSGWYEPVYPKGSQVAPFKGQQKLRSTGWCKWWWAIHVKYLN